jgi:hypothetical protein
MRQARWSTVAVFSAIVVLLSCAGVTTKVQRLGPQYPPRSDDCEIEFYKDGKPSGAFEEIARIESHIKKNVFASGTAELEDEAYDELGHEACELGGDAVIIDDYMESSASEMTHVHVWATVIKFK